MPSPAQTERVIVPSLFIAPDSEWRSQLERIERVGIASIALLFRGTASDERREAYRQLERSAVTSIPYVGLQPGMESWELDFLASTCKTAWFSSVASDSTYAFLASIPQHAEKFLIENPYRQIDHGAFSEQSLNRSEAAGICLNLATLERNRLSDRKAYDATLFVADHHPIKVSTVSSVPTRWYRRLMQHPARPGKLSSLSELSYVRHVPANVLASLIVIALDNTIDEQLEAGSYLSSLIK